MISLQEQAIAILETSDPVDKAKKSVELGRFWKSGAMERKGKICLAVPDRPARPRKPELLAPGEMPKRKYSGERGRAALLHAVAHIELNAIDLAWDLVARQAFNADLPDAFMNDWVKVGAEEGKHFLMVNERLNELKLAYGALPAHDGLWEAAETTAHDVLARLAVVPMVLEARGLDVNPPMMEKLRRAGDTKSAQVLEIILEDEIGHVSAGTRWFLFLCEEGGLDPKQHFETMVATYFKGELKPPFNEWAREQAGLPKEFYS